jgi:hypothetical protein
VCVCVWWGGGGTTMAAQNSKQQHGKVIAICNFCVCVGGGGRMGRQGQRRTAQHILTLLRLVAVVMRRLMLTLGDGYSHQTMVNTTARFKHSTPPLAHCCGPSQ